ncbi:MAG: sugar phosphate nucleotidyltransferase, partial [Dehalococcoidia bacterium]
LRPLTLDTPKVLLHVGGRPLIHRTLEALYSVGIDEVAVVVGHKAARVVPALMQECWDVHLEYIENHDWRGGNALSLSVARDFVMGGPFIMCMGDHLVSPEMLATVVAAEDQANVLCVDSQAWHPCQLDEPTRVLVGPEGLIAGIGKELAVWNAVDTGVFKLDGDVFEAIDHLKLKQGIDVEMSDVVRLFGHRSRPFGTCDILGSFWADIDTLEDYQSVDRLMGEWAASVA